MRALLVVCVSFLASSSLCFAQGGAGGGPCVRYIVPHDYERVCATFSTITCSTGQTYQCGNPETLNTCLNKSFKYHGDDYDATVKKQRDANAFEEGRERDDMNPDQYECYEEGNCKCRWSDTYWKCQGKSGDVLYIDVVDWNELSNVQCFGVQQQPPGLGGP